MLRKKPDTPSASRSVNCSTRLTESDARRVEAVAKAHDWTIAKTIQKLVTAALDAKVLK
jgi:hypothetical protein